MANAISPWLAVAFVVGARMPTRSRAAMAGIATLFFALAGYYAMTKLHFGIGAGTGSLVRWGLGALVGGPVFGMAGFAWRHDGVPQRAIALGLLAAVYIAEGIYQARVVAHPETGVSFIAVWLLIPVLLGRSMRDRLRAYAAAIPALALGALGFTALMAGRRGGRDQLTRPIVSPSRHQPTVGSAMMALAMQTPALPDRPILVVDDDAKIVRLVRTYLERDGFAVVTAGDGPAALAAIEEHRPALVVLDLMLPELDGRAVIRAVRRDEEAGATPILVLSARGTTLDRIAGLEDGADDYLPKPFSPAELVVRVKAILRRASTTPEPTAATAGDEPATARPRGGRIAHNDLVLDPERHEVSIAGSPVQLTHVEFRLLQALLEADGRVLSRDQLLDAVWGAEQSEVLDRTVDVHIRRLRDKLGDDPDAPRWVATVRGAGYRSAPADG